jgi:hypothetical protein
MKYDGVWDHGFSWTSAPQGTLALGQSTNIVVKAPFHITAPIGATNWRVTVENWQLEPPTRWQLFKDATYAWATKNTITNKVVVYTIYSSEIAL